MPFLLLPFQGIMKITVFSVLGLLLPLLVLSQQQVDTLLQLPDVSVQGTMMFPHQKGRTWERMDTAVVNLLSMQDLGQLMSATQAGYIKSYGPAGISSSSFRGGNAAHTVVLWNGVNVQNPMLGQTELSLFPLILADQVLLSKGGPETAGIQGALGGAIHIKNAFGEKGTGGNVQSSLGSFGRLGNAGKIYYGNRRIKGITRGYHQLSENDFNYFDLQGNSKKLDHAKVVRWGLVQDVFMVTGTRSSLEGHFWTQKSHRLIPPNRLQIKSVAEQDDESWRNVVLWKKWTNAHAFSITCAYLTEQLNYRDSIALINSESFSRTINLKAEHQYYPDFGNLRFALEYQRVRAESNNYDFNPLRNLWTGNAAFRKQFSKSNFETEISLAASILDGDIKPVLPGLHLKWKAHKLLSLNVGIFRNFRVPTFNDLYWTPGGNPGLEPEKSWSFESGVSFHPKVSKNKLKWNGKVQIFSRKVDNWIVWLPQGLLWQPVNAKQVWSRGVEVEAFMEKPIATGTLRINGRYNLILSTNSEVSGNQETLDKQLIYQPAHSGSIGLSCQFKNVSSNYNHQLVGKVFTTTDNLHEISGYSTGDLSLSRYFDFNKWSFSLSGTVFNIWNTDYEIVAFYPMPGRHFQLKFSTNIP
ncbi:MAG: TonB-dependent receptor [Bacteroidetes bacterium]|nr:MAG: TonB-dependent receptor [Bacteroidota bacterium]